MEETSSDTWYHLGVAYYRSGYVKQAIKALERCLEVDPDFAMAYYRLGIAFYHRGNLPHAKECYEKLLAIHPESKIAHYHLGIVCNALGEYECVLKNFEVIEKRNPEDAALMYHMGYAYFHLHDVTKAVVKLRRALELNPQHRAAQLLLDSYMDSKLP